MIGILIVPTGIGCEIGGHAGDSLPACKLIASCCDTLITHPNVVNASYSNEMPDNVLYVEGSQLNQFLAGERYLKEVYRNKILIVVNKIDPETVNMVSASRVTIGCDVTLIELETELKMVATMEDGKAGGIVTGWEALVEQVVQYEYDALAIYTEIECPRGVSLNYYKNGGVNPWGGVEAIASKLIARKIGKPIAHAPVEATSPDDIELYRIQETTIVDPRIAPEAVSTCYLHCVLKGLNTAPRAVTPDYSDLNRSNIDFMVSPSHCWGPPHKYCQEIGIPIVTVAENEPSFKVKVEGPVIELKNYLEVAGWIMALKAGVCTSSVRRPLEPTLKL